jgi:hypothetical protein
VPEDVSILRANNATPQQKLRRHHERGPLNFMQTIGQVTVSGSVNLKAAL